MANKMNSAILITYDKEDAVTEAIGLCHAAGIQVLHTIKQGFLKKPKYGISGGVLEKLEEIAEKLKPDVIVFDEILKPSQNYNLASVLHREILDREALILEIFESRASSAESKLQVKLAQLRYEMVRAKERVRLSSMGEQPGFMGIGKFEIDVYHNDIKQSDIFCLPTLSDCLPIVLAEAGAAGLPVISTGIAAIPEIIQEGETGFLVPPGDVKTLARALQCLIQDPHLRLRQGQTAQQAVQDRFDASRNASQLLSLMKQVSDAPRGTGS